MLSGKYYFAQDIFQQGTAAGLIGTLAAAGLNKLLLAAESSSGRLSTLIDFTRCDGCKSFDTLLYVQACSVKNQANYPEPIKPKKNYWPQEKY